MKDACTVPREAWEVPTMRTELWLGKSHRHCVVVPVINEGQRITSLLQRMAAQDVPRLADIIIIDGGSTDGSLAPGPLQALGVRGLLKFGRTLDAAERGNYEEAARQMLASKWAGQVGQRAHRLAAMMRGE